MRTCFVARVSQNLPPNESGPYLDRIRARRYYCKNEAASARRVFRASSVSVKNRPVRPPMYRK